MHRCGLEIYFIKPQLSNCFFFRLPIIIYLGAKPQWLHSSTLEILAFSVCLILTSLCSPSAFLKIKHTCVSVCGHTCEHPRSCASVLVPGETKYI